MLFEGSEEAALALGDLVFHPDPVRGEVRCWLRVPIDAAAALAGKVGGWRVPDSRERRDNTHALLGGIVIRPRVDVESMDFHAVVLLLVDLLRPSAPIAPASIGPIRTRERRTPQGMGSKEPQGGLARGS